MARVAPAPISIAGGEDRMSKCKECGKTIEDDDFCSDECEDKFYGDTEELEEDLDEMEG